MHSDKKITGSGIEIRKFYSQDDQKFVANEYPGAFPFTRGVYSDMYRGKLWTMRQHTGLNTIEENNKWFHYLLQQGEMALSVAFAHPTQIGQDSDHTMSEDEAGKVGVAIDSIEDMEMLFKGIKLEDVSTSLNINATGFILLAFYIVLAKRQGADLKKINGTLQNDILTEYAIRGTYIYPLKPSMRIATDIFAWCNAELPKWNTTSISGYHIREAGSNAVQEIAFSLSNGKAYVQAALERGLDINVFAKSLSFFLSAHNNLFEEVAKFRAARRMWAKMMKEMGATDEKAMMLRFHTQTGSSTLTTQQPLNNISRVTLQALSAVLGGTQSLHTNGYDNSLPFPTGEADRIALRSQQILAYESGVSDTADPLAGSYFVEALTDEVEQKAMELIAVIDAVGGSVQAIGQGFIQDEISKSAGEYHRKIENGEQVIVSVNKFASADTAAVPRCKTGDSMRQSQTEKLDSLRRRRDPAKCDSILQGLNDRAAGDENIMPAVIEAVENNCTLGEIADTLREIYGEHR